MTRFFPLIIVSFAATIFAVFPLTDTDIWWHLACAREWVTTWTPVRAPVVNVHHFFQQSVYFIYNLGGPLLLVGMKALLWGAVFALFLVPFMPRSASMDFQKKKLVGLNSIGFAIFILFVFRYQMEARPILFSLLFLGVYWNLVPWIFRNGFRRLNVVVVAIALLGLQWLWCKCQGLFVLGPIFASLCLVAHLLERVTDRKSYWRIPEYLFVVLLWIMPFFFREGASLFLYPFGLLDRLMGFTPSAAAFASEIAENRSPVTLLLAGENVVQSLFAVMLSLAAMVYAGVTFARRFQFLKNYAQSLVSLIWLVVTAILALVAERNFLLFLPVLLAYMFLDTNGIKWIMAWRRTISALCAIVVALVLGMWCKSLGAYDSSMVSKQRVPVDAAQWMQKHPHEGRLFNDDRAGGYLSFVNPSDSVYLDGRFILKTADFFERYLAYAEKPANFIHDMDSLGVDRAIFPLRYYARWDKLLMVLSLQESWKTVYRDDYFVVLDHEIKK